MNDLETLTDIFKALADPTRLKLIKLLTGQSLVFCGDNGHCGGETFLCVNALAHQLGVTQSAVSQHLRVLRQAKLVKGERRGNFMHYSINSEGLKQYRSIVMEILGERF